MRNSLIMSLVLSASQLFQTASAATIINAAETTPSMKEWTMLIYLNGNNNLDSFGSLNINQMEKVGSTDDINIVTQWASARRDRVQRLYVIKDNNSNKVTSPILQDLGDIDMGSPQTLQDFIHWGVTNFPAKHYFIDVWDHGSGWHATKLNGNLIKNFQPFDISWDDNTGNSITTIQLAKVLADAAQFIGHKVDFYASDACLMGMIEIAHEVANSVSIYGGSEEVEPGAGWAYDTFLARWAAHPHSTPQEVATYLTEEYVNAYNGGEYGHQDATFAAYDLDKLPPLLNEVSNLASEFVKLPSQSRASVVKLARNTLNFSFSDYGDLGDFIGQLEKSGPTFGKGMLANLKGAMKDFIVVNAVTPNYTKAQGLAIWLPTSRSTYESYANQYAELQFQAETHWGDALKTLFKKD